METKRLKSILGSFKNIHPKNDFSASSKRLVLQSQQIHNEEGNLAVSIGNGSFSILNYFTYAPRAISFVLGSLVILVSVYYATRELSPLFLPGLNEKKVVAEAEIVNSNINIQISQLDHFQKTSAESLKVLDQVSKDQFNHLNQTILDKETKVIQSGDLDSTTMNSDLNSIIKALSQ
ncbi:MAG: hypothetical protein WC705_02895 [Candidatus Paceibacterota bacterium]|jgi:hypothetical protein